MGQIFPICLGHASDQRFSSALFVAAPVLSCGRSGKDSNDWLANHVASQQPEASSMQFCSIDRGVKNARGACGKKGRRLQADFGNFRVPQLAANPEP